MPAANIHLFRQPTYAEIKARHDEKITSDRSNRHTAINGWMKHHGFADGTFVENEFGTEFNARLSSYLAGFATATQEKRSSILRQYQTVYFELVETGQLPAIFLDALKVLIVPYENDLIGLAKKASISLENLKGWVEGGVVPGFRSEGALGRLENALEVPVGTLTNRLPHLRLGKKRHQTGVTAYGRRVQKLKDMPFRLPFANWPDLPRKQWQDLVTHKTRTRLLPGELRNKRWNVDKKGRCESAEMRQKFIENFFGFLSLSPNPGKPELSGLGLRWEDLDLALLSDPELLEAFIQFLAVRSGVTTEIGRTLLDFVFSLCQEETGWFCQQPAVASHPLLAAKMPTYAEIRRKRIELTTPDERWMEWLNCTCKWIKGNEKSMKETYEKGRDHEAIEPCLAMKHPMDWLFQLADTMEKHLPVLSSRRTLLAVAYRNLLLIRFLIANPLRIKMFAIMTYRLDNTGHLHQRPGGDWWLRFSAKDFKNSSGAAKEPYCVPLSKTLASYIERYLKIYRPLLAGAAVCDYMFRPMSRKDCDPIAQMDEEALSDAVRGDTQHFLPESKGFGPHGFRHIIATDTIRNDKVQGWQRAATALHDTLETVRKNYAHLKTSDDMEHWNDYHDLKKSRTDSHYRDPKVVAAMEILKAASARGVALVQDLIAELEAEEKKFLFFRDNVR